MEPQPDTCNASTGPPGRLTTEKKDEATLPSVGLLGAAFFEPGRRARARCLATGAIEGVIIDQDGDLPLPGVIVKVAGTRTGTVTDQQGKFAIAGITPGECFLTVELVGYSRHTTVGIVLRADETIDVGAIRMVYQPIPIKEIVVSPGSYALMGRDLSIRQTLSSEDIEIMGWAEDITRAVQRTPGIVSDEYGAQFSIRGGDADEVLVLLDGMQVYRPFHQKDFGGGLFSTVDIESIAGVDLLTGGFTAEYGDRMSGVLDMRTKTPVDGRRQTSIGVSLMNARFFSMGPVVDGQGSYLISARRGYLDLLNHLMNNEFNLEPSYYDLLGKVDYRMNDSHTLSIHGFLANDSYGLSEAVLEPNESTNIDSVDSRYGNGYGWLTLKSVVSDKAYARTILYGGSVTKRRDWRNFDLDPSAHLRSATINDRADLDLVGLKQDWDYQVSTNSLLKMGMDLKILSATFDYAKEIKNEFITADHNLTEQADTFSTAMTETGNQLGLYLANRLKLSPPLTVEAGVRYDRTSYAGDNLWSPRLSAVYSLSRGTFARAGWGYYHQTQGIDELEVQFGELAYHPAERAEHFLIGFEHLFRNGLHLRAEGYHKRMTNPRDERYSFSDIDEFFPEARDDLVRLSFDGRTARGIETYLKYDAANKLSWWLSYVLAEAKDDVAEIDYDGALLKRTGNLPRAWDQRHTLNIDANYRLNTKWHFNLTGQFRTGWPSTDFTVRRIKRADGSFAYYQDRGIFRGTRVPSYQRLDARINRHFKTRRGMSTVFLHIINLYNHENIIRFDHDLAEANEETFRPLIESETWFGITPFLGVNWEL